jgi:hypothetical protein
MTDSVSPFDKQIANRNYMSPLGFKLVLTKTPKVDFLCQSANIPSISMGTAIQPSYLKDIPVPGDKVLYDDLNVRFLVDEKMENYLAIHKWITGLGYPESIGQYRQLKTDDKRTDRRVNDSADPLYFQYSDATLQVLNSNYKPSVLINFKDAFPVSLSTLDFDVTTRDYNYFTAEVTFKYTIYNITDPSGNRIDNYFKK